MVNIRTLDLNLLRVFDALNGSRNVTRASEALGLSQPAVSAALQRLRDQLGDPLFVRVGNRMAPTDRALSLAEPISGALETLSRALESRDEFDPATATDTFTLRGADFFSIRLMPALSARLAEEAPGISLCYLDSARGNLWHLLEADEIDLALEQPFDPPSWVSQTLLFPSPFVVIAARGNPALAGVQPGARIPLDAFCSLPHALRSTDGSMSGMTDVALARMGRSRRVQLALPHFEATVLTVSKSRMISVVPQQLAEERAVELALDVFQPPIDIPVPKMQLYWHTRHDNAPAQRWLRRRLLEEVAHLWGTDADFDRAAMV